MQAVLKFFKLHSTAHRGQASVAGSRPEPWNPRRLSAAGVGKKGFVGAFRFGFVRKAFRLRIQIRCLRYS